MSRFWSDLSRIKVVSIILPLPDSFWNKFARIKVLLLSRFPLVGNLFHWRLPIFCTKVTLVIISKKKMNMNAFNLKKFISCDNIWYQNIWPCDLAWRSLEMAIIWGICFSQTHMFSFSYIHFIEIILSHLQLHWNNWNLTQYIHVRII